MRTSSTQRPHPAPSTASPSKAGSSPRPRSLAPAEDSLAIISSDTLEMLVAMAHDLRSPLTSILFLAETVARGRSGPVTEVQERQLALIYGAALGLNSITSDLIELARDGDRLVEKEPVPLSVTGVLYSVRDIVQPIAQEKRLAVRLFPPTRDRRMGHPLALTRVLLNLTSNALQHSEAGYVEIVTREGAGDRVEFSVRDGGRGIGPEGLSALYQPLQRRMDGNGVAFSQSGLGLLLCRELVAAMGSELKVETRPRRGTRFYFELRLARWAVPTADSLPSSSAPARRRESRRPSRS